MTDKDWASKLTQEQFHILREKGTEAPFTGKYHDSHESGMFICAACGNELFSSENKFDSGTGWPSFYQPAAKDSVAMDEDKAFGMVRTEVKCSRCGGHLGHVFDDGPEPTGQRFCINSGALDLKK